MVNYRKSQITRVPVGTEYLEFTLPSGVTPHSGYMLHLYRLGAVEAQLAIYPQVEGHPLRFAVDEDLTNSLGTFRADIQYANAVVFSTTIEVVPYMPDVVVTPIAGQPICHPLPVGQAVAGLPPPLQGSDYFGVASC